MTGAYETIMQLTSKELPELDRSRSMNDFAFSLGWQPSDHLVDPKTSEFANAHLLVEHGLENTAVFTFLRGRIDTPRCRTIRNNHC